MVIRQLVSLESFIINPYATYHYFDHVASTIAIYSGYWYIANYDFCYHVNFLNIYGFYVLLYIG